MTDGDGPSGKDAAHRRHAPATARNREVILEVLSRVLPAEGTILEVGSGTGEHAAFFAARLAPRIWQPSDPDPEMRRSIAAYAALADCPTLMPPLDLDVRSPDWPMKAAAALVSINMIHIAPWAAAEGLDAGAGRLLGPGGVLFLYGPFRRQAVPTAPGNLAFDRSLRAQNPDWGLRDLEDLEALAEPLGFAPPEVVEMPANNLSLVFRRA